MTHEEMLEAIHKHVKTFGKKVSMRGGYEVFMTHIGACQVHAYTEDEGWTHGIYVSDMLDCFVMHTKPINFHTWHGPYGKESLESLHRLMCEGLTNSKPL